MIPLVTECTVGVHACGCVCCGSTDKAVLVSTGFHGDVLTLTKLIEARLKVTFAVEHFSWFVYELLLLELLH